MFQPALRSKVERDNLQDQGLLYAGREVVGNRRQHLVLLYAAVLIQVVAVVWGLGHLDDHDDDGAPVPELSVAVRLTA